MKQSSRTLRRLFRYPSVMVSLVLISILVAISIYAMVSIPYEEAKILWRGGEEIWYANPRQAAPEWFNWFSKQKKPVSFSLKSSDPEAVSSSISTDEKGNQEITLTYDFEYTYDRFPQEVILYFDATFAKKQPYAEAIWVNPEGKQTRLTNLALTGRDSYRVSSDEKLKRFLRGVEPMQGLFQDPEQSEPTPLKGHYQVIVTAYTFEKDSTVDAELVLHGTLAGWAGTDHLRRDLGIALLWGTPIALAFGLLAAAGTSVLTMMIAAIGAWYGGWIDELRVSNNLRYTADFDPPTSTFTADASTIALLLFNENAGTSAYETSGAGAGPSNGVLSLGGSPAGPEWSYDVPFLGSGPTPTPMPTPSPTPDPTLADINQDGRVDVVVPVDGGDAEPFLAERLGQVECAHGVAPSVGLGKTAQIGICPLEHIAQHPGHLADAFGEDGGWFEGENYHLFALRGLIVGLHWARTMGFDLLEDMTTLFTTIYAGPDAQAPIYGSGQIFFDLKDVPALMASVKVTGTRWWELYQRIKAKAAFMDFAWGKVREEYLRDLNPLYDTECENLVLSGRLRENGETKDFFLVSGIHDKDFPWGDGEIFWDVLLVMGDQARGYKKYCITDRILPGLPPRRARPPAGCPRQASFGRPTRRSPDPRNRASRQCIHPSL